MVFPDYSPERLGPGHVQNLHFAILNPCACVGVDIERMEGLERFREDAHQDVHRSLATHSILGRVNKGKTTDHQKWGSRRSTVFVHDIVAERIPYYPP